MRAARWLWVLTLVAAVLLAGCAGDRSDGNPADGDPGTGGIVGPGEGETDDAEPREPPDVALEEIVSGLENPTLVTSAEDGTGRLFVLEQHGLVRVIEDGQLREEPYLDLTDRVPSHEHRGPEQGLLGLAFDPAFTENGRLYVSYTGHEGDSALVIYTAEEPTAEPPSGEGRQLLGIDQPAPKHNGGHLAFGPDGYLYYGLGDGGGRGDPEGNGQDPTTPLGALLRLDVSGEEVQAPEDNPFAGEEEGHGLVWAYGLRNPWRFSFDRGTGDLFLADVGQDRYEEVNHQPADSDGGENYGWNEWEASHAYEGEPSREGYTFPVLEYALEGERCAVAGGYVYRGEAVPELQGFYVYGDFCSGMIWAAQNTSEGWRSEVLVDTDVRIHSFGEDADGELYVVGRDGGIHRIVEA